MLLSSVRENNITYIYYLHYKHNYNCSDGY